MPESDTVAPQPPIDRGLYARASANALARDDVPAGHVAGHRWYLERPAGMAVVVPQIPAGDVVIDVPASVDARRYLALYAGIGADWLWFDRRTWPLARAATHLDRPDVEIHVLRVEGQDAGMAELALTLRGQPEIAYFGLMPGFTGRGFGPWFLARAILRAQAKAPKQTVHINTCTHDHPGALILYQKAGFRIVREQPFTIPDPRLSGILARDSARHVPLAAETEL